MSPTIAALLMAAMVCPASGLSLHSMHAQQPESSEVGVRVKAKVKASESLKVARHHTKKPKKASAKATVRDFERRPWTGAVEASNSSWWNSASNWWYSVVPHSEADSEAANSSDADLPEATAQTLVERRGSVHHDEGSVSTGRRLVKEKGDTTDLGTAWNDMNLKPNENNAPVLGSDLGWNYVKWSMCDVRVHSNLAGLGPDVGEQSIRYYNIATAGLGQGIDLVITANSEYQPNDVTHNGLVKGKSCFGQVNVKSDSSVELLFTLYLTGTNTSVAFEKFYLTLYDLDSSNDATESFTVYNRVNKVYTYPSHELLMSGDLSTGLTFTSTTYGDGGDNPKHPRKLTELQKQRSVMFDYIRQSQWKILFNVAGGGGGRNFVFAGRSNVDETNAPTPRPSQSPTLSPTVLPSASPTLSPTEFPSPSPTASPTRLPTPAPTSSPTEAPTVSPTVLPTVSPTVSPTASPTASPSVSPTASPTILPTISPTLLPTSSPTPVQRAETTTLQPKDKGTTTTTTACESCIIWGDPHIITFDVHRKRVAEHPHREAFFRTRRWQTDELSVYEAGTFWLFRSRDVEIQGRYVANTTNPKFTSLGGLAVGGAFLGGNKFVVRPLEATAEWNGEEILAEMPSEFENSFVRARYSKGLELVANGKRGPAIEVSLPNGVNLMVNRWQHSLAARISMCNALAGPSQGQCGSVREHEGEQVLLATRVENHVSSIASMFAEDW